MILIFYQIKLHNSKFNEYIRYIKPLYKDRENKRDYKSIYDDSFITILSVFYLFYFYELINIDNNKTFITNIVNSQQYDSKQYNAVICEILDYILLYLNIII